MPSFEWNWIDWIDYNQSLCCCVLRMKFEGRDHFRVRHSLGHFCSSIFGQGSTVRFVLFISFCTVLFLLIFFISILSKMRNLVQLSTKTYSAPCNQQIQAICDSADDADFLYSCSTSIQDSESSSDEITISIHLIKRSNSSSNAILLAQFDTINPNTINHNDKAAPPLILSFQLLTDSGSTFDSKPSLSIITSTGDLVLLPLSNDLLSVDEEYAKDQLEENPDSKVPSATVLGSVSDGILDAKWSPDFELLVLVVPLNDQDGEEEESNDEVGQQKRLKTILMNLDFDVISEGPLQVDDFGQGE